MTSQLTLVDLPVRHVPVSRGTLAVADVAPQRRPGAPAAVFVPGYTGSKEDFALLVAPVVSAGYRFVAYDQLGQYQSPGPDDPAAYGVESLAADLLELLDTIGTGPVHLVGHSLGGLVARAATIRRPDAVASLVLLGSGPEALRGPRVEAYEALRPVLDAHGMGAVFDALLAGAQADPSRRPADDAVVAFLRTRFLASSEHALRGMGDALRAERDRTAELRATGVRVLVACGEHDDAWSPAEQRAMAERLGAPYAEIPGAVHSPAAERPRHTAELLTAFWAGG